MAKNLEPSVKPGIIEKLVPILVVLSIGLSFMVGVLWQKVSSLEKGTVSAATTTTNGTTPAGTTPANVTLDTIKSVWSQNVIKFGDASKKLLIVEVADPSCPYCHVAGGNDPEVAASIGTQFKYISQGGSYDPPVTEIKKLVDAGQASFAYVYFPGHGNGEMAMKALLCANEKGKFWDADQLLMSNAGYELQNTTVQNDKTKSGVVADFLKGAVDPTFIKSCLDSGKYDQALADQQNFAQNTLGLTGTPGFYINTTQFPGAYSWTDMKSAADSALK